MRGPGPGPDAARRRPHTAHRRPHTADRAPPTEASGAYTLVVPADRAVPTQGALRAVRAGALGGTSLLLATGAHLLAGGHLPGPLVLAVAVGVVGTVALALTARRCRPVLLVATLLVEQAGLHAVFGAAEAVSSCSTGELAAHHAGTATSLVCLGTGGHPMTAGGWSMGLAHLLATVATAVLLSCAERWLWRVADRLHAYASARPARRRARAGGVRAPRAVAHLPTAPDRRAPARAPPSLLPTQP